MNRSALFQPVLINLQNFILAFKVLVDLLINVYMSSCRLQWNFKVSKECGH